MTNRGIVNDFILCEREDKLLWRGSESGSFSVKMFTRLDVLLFQRINFLPIYGSWIRLKISALVYRIFHQVVPTDDAVIKIGFQFPSKCNCCTSPKSESLSHLCIHSDISKPVWQLLALLFNKEVALNIYMLGKFWISSANLKFCMDCLAMCMACCSLWEIWLYRNNMIHGQKNNVDM
ncbi:hypothetical protein QQ045_003351 [Rhodiola kirilowii]